MRNWFVMICLCLATQVSAQSLNTELIGSINYQKYVNDVWGYTDSSNEDYALVGLRDGVSIVKVELDTVYEVDRVSGASSIWRDLKTHSHYAYITNETGQGLMILDLSPLPDSVRFVKNDTSVFSTAHNLYIADGYLYTAGSDQTSGSAILDLADPENPVLVGTSTLSYYHDVFVQDDRLYASTGGRGSLAIFNVTDKSAPALRSEIFFPAAGYAHNAWATEDGNYVMTTEETIGKTVKMWDIHDPRDPVLISEYLSRPGLLAHNIHVKGAYAYLSHYADGLRIIDIANPENIVEVGYYDTYPGSSPGFDGCWGAFPFTHSGYIYASDQSTGLSVVSFNGRRASRVHGAVYDSLTSAPIGEADIELLELAEMRKTNAHGGFKLGFSDPGTYSLRFSKSGYDTAEVVLQLNEGEDVLEEIFLNPAIPTSISNTEIQPADFSLSQNFPNPFNAGTMITYRVAQQAHVALVIYDLLGNQVAELVNRVQPAGEYRVTWDGRDRRGAISPSGLYFYRMQAGSFSATGKMLFVQ